MISITHEHILLAAKIIPCITLAYILFKCRHAIPLNANIIKNASITAITVGAFTIMIANWMHETPQQRETRVHNENVTEQEEKIAEQIEEQKEREKLEDILPDKWGKLYQAILNISDEMEVPTIEAFAIQYGDTTERLPMEGFELIIDEMWGGDNRAAARKALTPYLIPFRDENLTRKPKYTEAVVKENP